MPANFQRDGAAAFYNQGSRPNYQSSIQTLTYKPAKYTTEKHERFLQAATMDLSQVTELDFKQPRDLWTRVYDQDAKDRFVSNVAGHLCGAKSDETKKRMLAVFGAVDEDLSARIAKEIGMSPVPAYKPLPASEGRRFRANLA